MTTLTYEGTLESVACWCGIGFAIPVQLYESAQRNHSQGFFCPLGHSVVFTGKSTLEKLAEARRDAEWSQAQARARALRDQLDASERSRAAIKGQVTKLRKRIGAGVCPVDGCRRHFQNVQAHIERMHPGFKAEGVADG